MIKKYLLLVAFFCSLSFTASAEIHGKLISKRSAAAPGTRFQLELITDFLKSDVFFAEGSLTVFSDDKGTNLLAQEQSAGPVVVTKLPNGNIMRSQRLGFVESQITTDFLNQGFASPQLTQNSEKQPLIFKIQSSVFPSPDAARIKLQDNFLVKLKSPAEKVTSKVLPLEINTVFEVEGAKFTVIDSENISSVDLTDPGQTAARSSQTTDLVRLILVCSGSCTAPPSFQNASGSPLNTIAFTSLGNYSVVMLSPFINEAAIATQVVKASQPQTIPFDLEIPLE